MTLLRSPLSTRSFSVSLDFFLPFGSPFSISFLSSSFSLIQDVRGERLYTSLRSPRCTRVVCTLSISFCIATYNPFSPFSLAYFFIRPFLSFWFCVRTSHQIGSPQQFLHPLSCSLFLFMLFYICEGCLPSRTTSRDPASCFYSFLLFLFFSFC